MPTTGAPPTWVPCGPFPASYPLYGSILCAGAPPYCPPAWSMCSGGGGFFPCACWPPDVAAQFEAAESNPTEGFKRNCVFHCFAPDPAAPSNLVSCECVTCPTGFVYDDLSKYCCDTSPCCPPGQCYCAASGQCVDCTTGKLCDGVATNVWDPVRCVWVPTAPPCDFDQYFDWTTCACVPCPAGQCWCEIEGRCIDCTGAHDPPCKTERGCVWNTGTCVWDCTDPPCAAGEHYDHFLCRCVPDCPAGQCWCEAASPGACIDCTEPDCAAELHCEWDGATCTWVCLDPPCIAPATWDPVACRCVGGEHPWNYFTSQAHYHAASDHRGIRYQRSETSIPPFAADVQITTDPAHTQPRMVRDWRGRWLLVYIDNSSGTPRVVERVSHDDGDTWSNPRTVFVAANYPMVAGPLPYAGSVVYAAYDAGNLRIERQYPGDLAPAASFLAVDETGADLVIDDASFGLTPAPDGAGRWLLHALIGGTLTHLISTDDCASWEVVA